MTTQATERRKRQRKSFADRLDEINERIAKHEAAAQVLRLERETFIAAQRARAKAMLSELPDATPDHAPRTDRD